MVFLLLNLLVLAMLAGVSVLAYAYVQAEQEDDAPAPSVDYGRLHALWHSEASARDWASLRDQVRRWHDVGTPGCAPAMTEQVARDLNAAVFRFALPGDALAFHAVAASGREHRHCPATRRARAVRWPL